MKYEANKYSVGDTVLVKRILSYNSIEETVEGGFIREAWKKYVGRTAKIVKKVPKKDDKPWSYSYYRLDFGTGEQGWVWFDMELEKVEKKEK